MEDREHHFREITKHVNSLKTLVGPIFIDEPHKYGEIPSKDGGVKEIHGPIYIDGNAKHHYSEQPKPSELQAKTLKGPIYINDDYKHHFSQLEQHLDSVKSLKGPVYDVESKNHFLEIMKHAETLKSLQGPIYEFGESVHRYTGDVLEPSPTHESKLHGPKYQIDSAHHFSEIVSQVEKLRDLKGTKTRKRKIIKSSLIIKSKPILSDDKK